MTLVVRNAAIVSFLLLGIPAAVAQRSFDIKDASKLFRVKIDVASCEDNSCSGKAIFSFFRKGAERPFQVITLPDTYIDLSRGGVPLVNTTMLYDEQSVLNVDDFNFDGLQDIALCDGTYGGYGGPSYQIYLASKATRKFVHSAAFTRLGQGPYLGMFDVDGKKKRLNTASKSGCCMHFWEEYDVVRGRPRKVKEVSEYYNMKNDGMVDTETKVLRNGKWRVRWKREKAKDE